MAGAISPWVDRYPELSGHLVDLRGIRARSSGGGVPGQPSPWRASYVTEEGGEPASLLRDSDYPVVAECKICHRRIRLGQVMHMDWRHAPLQTAVTGSDAARSSGRPSGQHRRPVAPDERDAAPRRRRPSQRPTSQARCPRATPRLCAPGSRRCGTQPSRTGRAPTAARTPPGTARSAGPRPSAHAKRGCRPHDSGDPARRGVSWSAVGGGRDRRRSAGALACGAVPFGVGRAGASASTRASALPRRSGSRPRRAVPPGELLRHVVLGAASKAAPAAAGDLPQEARPWPAAQLRD